MHNRLPRAAAAALTLSVLAAGTVVAHPDNTNTARFVLSCDDGQVWNASFNGGPAAFHLQGGGVYIWKEIAFVTPEGDSGTVGQGIQGFSGAPIVTCTYTGPESGNAYTVKGFYPPAR
jgi:hypothetical protein